MTVPPDFPRQPPVYHHPAGTRFATHKKTNAHVLWMAGGSVGVCLLALAGAHRANPAGSPRTARPGSRPCAGRPGEDDTETCENQPAPTEAAVRERN